ncbi:MAG: hypothetical protein ACRENS_07065 [Candidatus Eiseniibacteriota bacterium]
MKPMRREWISVLSATLLLSCASSEQLTQRSQKELSGGQAEKAYQTAIVALKHKPENRAALAALAAAATELQHRRQDRVRSLAFSDTVAAAGAALELRSFHAEVLRYGGELPQDPAYNTEERAILMGAAARQYRAGISASQTGDDKEAYRRFSEAREYWPGYRDVEVRAEQAFRDAHVRLAILPFDDEMKVPGLAEQVRQQMAAEVAHRLRPDQLVFTEIVPQSEIDRRITVDEQWHMNSDRAVAIGRRLGASRVVWGRIYGAHFETNTDRYVGSVFRREEHDDSLHHTITRYVEVGFEAVRRERNVTVRVSSEVLDTDQIEPVTQRERTLDAAARTVYTSYQPDGDCNRYLLVPPDLQQRDGDRAQHIQSAWHDTFGSWTVPNLLQCARDNHGRRSYRSEYRDEFRANTVDRPYFLDDMPTEADLLAVALLGSGRDIVDQVREQDDK